MTALSTATIQEIARWLAPYVAKELEQARGTGPQASPSDYPPEICETFARELGQGVLNRAVDFFSVLNAEGRVGSLALAEIIGTSSPRNIPANLTNSLKQRARKLRLDLPWDETVSEDDRTVWLDRNGIADRMANALRAEQRRRLGR